LLPASWRPRPMRDPIRVGSHRDGGYVVPEASLLASRLLISMGLEADWTFEETFVKRAEAPVICFDHTVNPSWWAKRTLRMLRSRNWTEARKYIHYRRFFGNGRAVHRQQEIGDDSGETISLKRIMAEQTSDSVFLKIDIEGAEYLILDDIVNASDRITCVVIEFHAVDQYRQEIDQFVTGLKGFVPVWAHGNNNVSVDANGDPRVLEMTLARLGVLADHDTSADVQRLTTVNNHFHPEIDLRFSP
jgi:Methyltransferase FkbM domain